MRISFTLTFIIMLHATSAWAQPKLSDEEQNWLNKAETYEQDGWIYLYAQGKPFERGFQNGYLLAKHIDETIEIVSYYLEKSTEKKWDFYRSSAKSMFWPALDDEYRNETDGIVAGMNKAGVTKYDNVDITAYNGWIELAWYYLPQTKAHGSCSAFIATGNATYDGRIVIAHNLWYEYMFCRRVSK